MRVRVALKRTGMVACVCSFMMFVHVCTCISDVFSQILPRGLWQRRSAKARAACYAPAMRVHVCIYVAYVHFLLNVCALFSGTKCCFFSSGNPITLSWRRGHRILKKEFAQFLVFWRWRPEFPDRCWEGEWEGVKRGN